MKRNSSMGRNVQHLTSSLDSKLAAMTLIERAAAITQLRDLLLEYELTDILDSPENSINRKALSCTHCGSAEFARNGFSRGRQRYRCSECGRTFIERRPTNIISRSKLSRATWMRYINCFVDGLPVAKCAANCGVSVPTAYFMRLRILKVIEKNLPEWHVGSGQEASLDETFVLESFKGNRSRCKDFEMPRPALPRGRRSPHGPKRTKGISRSDFLCVVSGVDGEGRAFFDIASRGTLQKGVCEDALDGRIGRGAVVTTDDHHAYDCLEKMGASHRICVSTAPEGEINRVNTLHSAFKAFLSAKRGVSSRRLHLYLAEFSWRWAFTRADERTADTARRVISQIAKTEASGLGASLSADEYPFIEFWGTQQGQDEKRRLLLAARQFVINRELQKHRGDAEKEAELRMRQRKLDHDIADSGLKQSGIGKGVYDNQSVTDLAACTASMLRNGKKPNVGAVRKFLT